MNFLEIPAVRCGCTRVINTRDIEIYRQYVKQDPINGGELAIKKLGLVYHCCINNVINIPRIQRGQGINPSDTLLPREVDVEPSKFVVYNSQRPRGPEQKRTIDLSVFNRTVQPERFFDYTNVSDFGQDLYAVYDFWSELYPKTEITFRHLRFLIAFAGGNKKPTENVEDLLFENIDNNTYESYVQSPANYFLVLTCDEQDYVFLYCNSVSTQVLCFINDKLETIVLKTVPQSLPTFLGKFIQKDKRFLNRLFGYDIPTYTKVEIKMYRLKVYLPLPRDLLPLINQILVKEKDQEVKDALDSILTKINIM